MNILRLVFVFFPLLPLQFLLLPTLTRASIVL
jgi:hypothetical protein